jgi:hypothetical protein
MMVIYCCLVDESLKSWKNSLSKLLLDKTCPAKRGRIIAPGRSVAINGRAKVAFDLDQLLNQPPIE